MDTHYQHRSTVRLVTLLLLIASVAMMPQVTSAQPRQVLAHPFMIYDLPNYAGTWCYSNVPETANVACNEITSSIQLEVGWSVRLYRDVNQQGPQFCLSRSDTNLSDNTYEDGSAVDNTISSFTLFNSPFCGTAGVPAYPLEVFTDPAYGGTWCYSAYAETNNIHVTCDNLISSVLLRAGWSMRVYDGANQQGATACLTGSDSNVADNTFTNGAPMNDAISSFVLYNTSDCAASSTPPIAPGNPVATAITQNSVSMSWADNSNNEVGFKVYRWNTTLSTWVVVGTVGANTTSFTVTNLTCSTQYYFNVNAYNGYGEVPAPSSGWLIVTTSACATVGTPIAQPVIPTLPAGNWNVPYYWQGDPRWGNNKIGACNNNIRNVGCALTSLAMVFASYGTNQTPATLNSCMGNDACLMHWGSSKINDCSAGKVVYKGQPAFSYALLEQELKSGPVILQLLNKSTGGMHFIVVIGGSGSDPSNYRVNDPGIKGGSTNNLKNTLALWYKAAQLTPARLFLYKGTNLATTATIQSANVPDLDAPQPLANEVVSGVAEIYANTDAGIVLELATQSSASTVTDMRIWTDQHPSDIWQPFSPYVQVPLDGKFYVQFRDTVGNMSAIIESNYPVAPSTIQQDILQVSLPLIVR